MRGRDKLATHFKKWEKFVTALNTYWEINLVLLYLLDSTRAVIGQFSGPYSPVRPAKILKLILLQNCFVIYRQLF